MQKNEKRKPEMKIMMLTGAVLIGMFMGRPTRELKTHCHADECKVRTPTAHTIPLDVRDDGVVQFIAQSTMYEFRRLKSGD